MPSAVDRMLYWSVGGGGNEARYIHRTTLDGATANSVQRFVDVTDKFSSAAAVQDIVIDVRSRRYSFIHSSLLCPRPGGIIK